MVRPTITVLLALLPALLTPSGVARCAAALSGAQSEASLTIRSRKLGGDLKLDGLFYETSAGRVKLPRELTATVTSNSRFRRSAKMDDGRSVTVSLRPDGPNNFNIRLSAEPGSDVVKWGLAADAKSDEYYTGLMERVVDGEEVSRGDFVLMPRGAYTGSSAYGVFWGGDIGGTQEGLRASIIGAQRAAVMGYPNWGSDTCGYNEQLMEQEVCARWLEFSCFTPIIRPLWLVDPRAREAWTNWWSYLYCLT